MNEQVDIRSLAVDAAAKLLKVQPKTIRVQIRRGLPLVDNRIDLIVYGAWLNQQVGPGERHAPPGRGARHENREAVSFEHL